MIETAYPEHTDKPIGQNLKCVVDCACVEMIWREHCVLPFWL